MKRIPTKEEALLSMADLCARSEQCAFDISRKLRAKGLSSDDVSAVVAQLEARGFIDSFRFARSFARDKVRFSAWGKLKISAALAARRIPRSVIADALREIDADDYENALQRSAVAKARQLDLASFDDRQRLCRHLLSRGFEGSLVVNMVNRIREKQ